MNNNQILTEGLISFLEAQGFTQEELKDTEYISDKVTNFFEDKISDKRSLLLAKAYQDSKVIAA